MTERREDKWYESDDPERFARGASWFAGKWIVVAVVFAIGLVGLIGYAAVAWNRGPGMQIEKSKRQVERQVNENSQQYVETQARAMRDQISQYNANAVELAKLQQDPTANADVIKQLQAAQNGIVVFVKSTAGTISADALPDDIRAFLDAHS